MGSNKKTLVVLALVAIIAVAFGLKFKDSSSVTYKGQILDTNVTTATIQKADLTCVIETQKSEAGDVTVDVEIKNNGPGSIDGSIPFKYGIYIDDQEVFTNIDSYSVMEAGDIVGFSYPISRAVYQYGDMGTVKCTVDIDSNVDEANEDNNEDTATY